MNKTIITKQELISRLEELPENYLEEVLDFINYLLSKKESEQKIAAQENFEPRKDPLLRFIGSIEHGALSKNIDKELYGE